MVKSRHGNEKQYTNRSKISEAKTRQLIRLFSLDLDAGQIATIIGLNRNTVNRYLAAIRERIAQFCEQISPVSGQVEVDESYFGGKHSGKRGRGAGGKVIVFGLFKRNGRVYTQIVPESKLRPCKGLSGVECPSIRSFIPTNGLAMMVWSIWTMKSTSALTMARENTSKATRTSTVLRGSGVMQSLASPDSGAFPNLISTYI